jgi:hypothetical protein
MTVTVTPEGAISSAVADAVSVPAEAPKRRLGPLSGVARRRKVRFFLDFLPQTARILDVGCADNWFKVTASNRGWTNVVGLDLHPPADVVGNIFDWQALGLEPHSFDAIMAYRTVFHAASLNT